MDANATTNTDRFDKIDSQFDMFGKQFARMDRKFDKIDKQLDKITTYMIKRFDVIDRKLEEKADKVDMQRALGLLDSLSKRQETYDQERLVMGHQIGRLDNWTHELANKIGHKLSA